MVDQDVERGLIVLFFGILGIVMAAIEQIAADNNYVINEYFGGAVSLVGVQILTIVAALLIGIIVAVVVKS